MLTLTSITNVGAASFAASATLQADVSGRDRAFFGTGTASGEIAEAAGGAFGDTDYFVSFRLTRPQQFSFEAAFDVSGAVVLQDAWLVDLFSEEPPPFSDIVFLTGRDTRQITRSGLLPAGVYGFQVITGAGTRASGINRVNQTFALSFADPAPAITPEPSSILLSGGALGLLASRWLRKRSVCSRGGQP